MQTPHTAAVWVTRAKLLSKEGRYFDALCSLQGVADHSKAAAKELQKVHSKLEQSLDGSAPHIEAATDARLSDAKRLDAWRTIMRLDPTNVHARAQVASADLQHALRLRDDEGNEADAVALAHDSLVVLRGALEDLESFQASQQQGANSGNEDLAAFLKRRHPNLAAIQYKERPETTAGLRALLELNLGLGTEIVMGLATPSSAALREAAAHYERAAAANRLCKAKGGKGENAHNVYCLWGAALERDPEGGGKAAADVVWAKGVKDGLWLHKAQRPKQLLQGLRAAPWHDAYEHATLRALRDAYPTIRAEALALLQADGACGSGRSGSSDRSGNSGNRGGGGGGGSGHAAGSPVFTPYASKALNTGEWADVGLFFNSAVNHLASERAPRTTALLLSSAGGLERDAVSCPLGSAYFSLLRPGSSLKAHCGPTNCRLRAHLGLVVPSTDPAVCGIRCGDEPPRSWHEGEVLLFDDSFEHEVWNHTSEPRLVLIVDIWHPQLQHDADRAKALTHEWQRERYRRALRGEHDMTTQRGH